LQLTLDGGPLAVEPEIDARVDPGPHVLVASAPGKRKWTSRVDLRGDAARVAVDVPRLDDEAEPPPNVQAPPERPAAPPREGRGGRTHATHRGAGRRRGRGRRARNRRVLRDPRVLAGERRGPALRRIGLRSGRGHPAKELAPRGRRRHRELRRGGRARGRGGDL